MTDAAADANDAYRERAQARRDRIFAARAVLIKRVPETSIQAIDDLPDDIRHHPDVADALNAIRSGLVLLALPPEA